MNKYIKKYRKIVDELIKESFPKLNEMKIRIYSKEIKLGSARADGFITKFFRLTIDPKKYKKAKKGVLKGVFAHELVHFSDYLDFNVFESILFMFKYHFNKNFNRNYELKTDKRVIERGYARELFSNRAFRLGKINKKEGKIKRNYMTPKEIKQYAKKIGKW